LADALFQAVPSGVGRGGSLRLNAQEMNTILCDGAPALLARGFGVPQDIEFCEEEGRMAQANAALVSKQAKERGMDQLGTLGSGNHFLEVQKVDCIYDAQVAQAFGLYKDALTVMIHCGSRGLGHQTCTDYVQRMMHSSAQWGITLPDRELVCAPFASAEAQEYLAAMAAAANFAWANRHVIGHAARRAWQQVLGKDAQLNTMYDISHNISKIETHMVDGKQKSLIMHRKGATRSFGPGRAEIPAAYRSVGQPVLIPGTMGTASYVLVGTNESMQKTFGSCCHGAGRRMSRMKAKKEVHGGTLRKQLESLGIVIRCDSSAGLAEEAPIAYKDVDAVVSVVHDENIARKVARLVPVAVIKGG
jgi:tRNA-splicing ligase RtcB